MKEQVNSEDDNSEEEKDEVDENLAKEYKKRKNNVKDNSRTSISAEVFGKFNKKTDFVPVVIPKTKEQVDRQLLLTLQNKEEIGVVLYIQFPRRKRYFNCRKCYGREEI